jgi:hypothetical protein
MTILMNKQQTSFLKFPYFRRKDAIARLAIAALVFASATEPAFAVSSWNPTLLVNTESFETIDAGSGNTDIELRFGDATNEKLYWDYTNSVFRFTDDLFVSGTLSGNILRVSGPADIHGALTASGAVRFDGNLTLNDDQTDGDTILTFGSDTINETLTFDDADDRFEFSDDVRATGTITSESTLSGAALRVSGPADIHGALTASGAIRTDGNLTINDDATAADATLTFGNDAGSETLTFTDATNEFDLSDDLNVTGTLDTTGNITTDADLTINEDQSAADATLTFGSDGTNETLKFANTSDRFEFSDDISTTGTITASGTITTEADLTLNDDQSASNITITFSDSDANETIQWNNTTQRFEFSDDIVSSATLSGTSLTVSSLKNCNLDTDANGLLTCGTDSSGAGSGQFFLIPQYPHTTYFQSGSNFVGQLYTDTDTGSWVNHYRWKTSKNTNQSYWLSTRVRVPSNFNAWEPQPIQIQYRSSGGRLDVFFRDTADSIVSLTGNTGLVSHDAWTTADITGPESAGTYTKDDYITLFVRMTASGGTGLGATADLGFIELNWDTQ